jgi:hypothetical protein
MAWTAPITWTDGAVLTAAQMNQQVRDNLLQTFPAKATTPGQYAVATGANAITMRAGEGQLVDSLHSVTSTSYAGGAGPSVTKTVTQGALVGIYSYIDNTASNHAAFMTFEVTGAHTLAALDHRAIAMSNGATIAAAAQLGAVYYLDGFTAGSCQFVARYRVSGGTGRFDHKRLWVMPY